MLTLQKPSGNGSKKIDIPLTEVFNVQKHFRELYRHAPMIGGRAVNILSFGSERPTHDIDIVIPFMQIDYLRNNLPAKSVEEGREYFTISWDGRNRPDIAYFSDVVSATMENGKTRGIGIDVYYPSYRSSVNGYRPVADISGIPIKKMLDTTQTAVINEMEFQIVNPVVLTVLKFQAWLDRGNRDKEAKDMQDIQNIFRNQFGRKEKFEEHIWNVKELMNAHRRKDARLFVYRLLENIDYDHINAELKDVAEELKLRMPP